jgi:hypothetical protein
MWSFTNSYADIMPSLDSWGALSYVAWLSELRFLDYNCCLIDWDTKQKWATFTYFGNETRTTTKLFKNTNLRIAYKTSNTLRRYLQPKNHDTDKYSRSDIYEIKCNSCKLKYIGQTGRNFRTHYKEHIQAIHTNKMTSRYTQHVLDTGHAYGTIEDTLSILHVEKKGPLMNTLEQFHIYRLNKDNLHLNDTYTDTYNPIFNLITKHYK